MFSSVNPSRVYIILHVLGVHKIAVRSIIAQIGGIDLAIGKDLDEAIAANERRDKLTKQIAALEKIAMIERQPRRKWEYAGKIKKLKQELEELSNG